MNYSDIIEKNIKSNSVSWWPQFAYHYTDVTNAASILDKGCLYSRVNVKKMGLMLNDNASRQVIDMTNTSVLSNVRFYFRPLTPTQYYNEGYKHPQLRYDNDTQANMPVPVFFLFDLSKLLSMKGVKFSEFKQAGRGSTLYDNVEDFSKFDFEKIYSNDFENFEECRAYRHAEILYPDCFKIDSCLRFVLCRNSVERNTLLNLIKEKNKKNYIYYRDKIKICRENMFYNNGLFITDCRYLDHILFVQFSDTYAKRKYTENQMRKNSVKNLKPLTLKIIFEWFKNSHECRYSETITDVNYSNISGIKVKIPIVDGATNLRTKIYIENDLVCYMEQSIEKAELIK